MLLYICISIYVLIRGRKNMIGIEKKIKILFRIFLFYNFVLFLILLEKNEKLDVYVIFIFM